MSSKYNLRIGVYEKIKNQYLYPLIFKSVKNFNSVTKGCCASTPNEDNENSKKTKRKKNSNKLNILRVIKSKSRNSEYFCLISEKNIKYFEWISSEQLNHFQKRLLDNPKEFNKKNG